MMIDYPPVSVIIVNFNGKHFLKDCLNSLENSDFPKDKLEVILVDNASNDGSFEYTKENYPWVKILKLDKNYGFCKPNNEGAKIAKGKYVVFLNNDTAVDKSWLSELIKGALCNKEVVSCASKILYYDRRDTINAAGGKITITGSGFYKGYGAKDGKNYNIQKYTGFGCGAGVLVDKEFFLNVNGFDEDYFASCEEHDLGWKSWLYGHKVLYVPTAVMYHKESGTFGSKSSFSPVKVYLITRNRLYNLFKNLETGTLMRAFLISVGFDIYRSAKYILNVNFSAVKSIIKAYIDFMKNIGKSLEKREVVQKNRKRGDKELYELGVIATLKESMAEEKRLNLIWKQDFYKL